MKLLKRLITLALTMCLLGGNALSVRADAVPDYNKKGSLSFSFRDHGKPVAGGALEVWKIAELQGTDGQYSYQFTSEFAASGASLDNLQSEELAEQFTTFAKSQKIAAKELTIGNDGKASAQSLGLGLYLVSQLTPAPGYSAVKPFLVSIPLAEDGKLIYDVDATPKMESVSPDKPKPTTTPTPGPSVTPTTPPGPLPQTGQLWWPVPLLAITGILLLMIGWINKTRTKR